MSEVFKHDRRRFLAAAALTAAAVPFGAAGCAAERGKGTVTEQRMYQLIRQPKPITERSFEIEFLDPGAEAFAFTFG